MIPPVLVEAKATPEPRVTVTPVAVAWRGALKVMMPE